MGVRAGGRVIGVAAMRGPLGSTRLPRPPRLKPVSTPPPLPLLCLILCPYFPHILCPYSLPHCCAGTESIGRCLYNDGKPGTVLSKTYGYSCACLPKDSRGMHSATWLPIQSCMTASGSLNAALTRGTRALPACRVHKRDPPQAPPILGWATTRKVGSKSSIVCNFPAVPYGANGATISTVEGLAGPNNMELLCKPASAMTGGPSSTPARLHRSCGARRSACSWKMQAARPVSQLPLPRPWQARAASLAKLGWAHNPGPPRLYPARQRSHHPCRYTVRCAAQLPSHVHTQEFEAYSGLNWHPVRRAANCGS